MWALSKWSEVTYTPTYGSVEEPCAPRVTRATKQYSAVKERRLIVEGEYTEFDGKDFW
jgi:hypothetical protein